MKDPVTRCLYALQLETMKYTRFYETFGKRKWLQLKRLARKEAEECKCKEEMDRFKRFFCTSPLMLSLNDTLVSQRWLLLNNEFSNRSKH